jgi:hypothetical protein
LLFNNSWFHSLTSRSTIWNLISLQGHRILYFSRKIIINHVQTIDDFTARANFIILNTEGHFKKKLNFLKITDIDYGASWSFLTRFLAKIMISFGFWKQLIRLHSYITQTEHKYLLNNKIKNWSIGLFFSEITEIV